MTHRWELDENTESEEYRGTRFVVLLDRLREMPTEQELNAELQELTEEVSLLLKATWSNKNKDKRDSRMETIACAIDNLTLSDAVEHLLRGVAPSLCSPS
jgi:hypothetical protein